ncbi:hypothetical protein [Candidatus Spongiihabitans sp.]|uniref:hypothetical protein n=1 Tax=Candidatus Spongiihabitans sp. TaxID=3101308 RepID=UPI003C70109A
MSGNKFLFIEILDEELVTLFQGLKSIFNDQEATSPVHITIKGPQKSNFKVTSYNKFSDSDYPLVISQSNCFSYSKKYFVHFKVQIPQMEKHQLWYKPTFPSEKNPHITVCETSDEDFSNDIVSFLNKEVGDLLCRDYEFLQYIPSHRDLVRETGLEKTRNIDDAGIPNLINIGKVRKGLFARAHEIKAKYIDLANRERLTTLHAN